MNQKALMVRGALHNARGRPSHSEGAGPFHPPRTDKVSPVFFHAHDSAASIPACASWCTCVDSSLAVATSRWSRWAERVGSTCVLRWTDPATLCVCVGGEGSLQPPAPRSATPVPLTHIHHVAAGRPAASRKSIAKTGDCHQPEHWKPSRE